MAGIPKARLQEKNTRKIVVNQGNEQLLQNQTIGKIHQVHKPHQGS